MVQPHCSLCSMTFDDIQNRSADANINLIFLDIDGIFVYRDRSDVGKRIRAKAVELFGQIPHLDAGLEWRTAASYFFYQDALENLYSLIKKVEEAGPVYIILSSPWGQHGTLDEVCTQMLGCHDFSKQIIGKTHFPPHSEHASSFKAFAKKSYAFSLKSQAEKIQFWLLQHGFYSDKTRFVIFDHQADNGLPEKFGSRFVCSKLFSKENITTALNILNTSHSPLALSPSPQEIQDNSRLSTENKATKRKEAETELLNFVDSFYNENEARATRTRTRLLKDLSQDNLRDAIALKSAFEEYRGSIRSFRQFATLFRRLVHAPEDQQLELLAILIPWKNIDRKIFNEDFFVDVVTSRSIHPRGPALFGKPSHFYHPSESLYLIDGVRTLSFVSILSGGAITYPSTFLAHPQTQELTKEFYPKKRAMQKSIKTFVLDWTYLHLMSCTKDGFAEKYLITKVRRPIDECLRDYPSLEEARDQFLKGGGVNDAYACSFFAQHSLCGEIERDGFLIPIKVPSFIDYLRELIDLIPEEDKHKDFIALSSKDFWTWKKQKIKLFDQWAEGSIFSRWNKALLRHVENWYLYHS